MDPSDSVSTKGSDAKLRDSKGWDGKLRVDKRAVLSNPEALSDPEWSDEDAPPVDKIEADEDLLEEYDSTSEDVDLVHCRISSTSSLNLTKFRNLERLCLRQNQITSPSFPENLNATLRELDLYDNYIAHVKGFDGLIKLTSLDLSFNKIKHIKNVSHLKELKELYLVQNKIARIENLNGLENLKMLELAANRIRDIENLEQLQSLEELWLGKNKIAEIKNISNLSKLRLLSIQSNRLTSISGLSALVNLEELYASHNLLTDLSGLHACDQIKVLDVSNNKIEHLAQISHLEHLEEFWASSNLISSFDELEKELADKQELKTVYFEGNPLQTRNLSLYRNKVKLTLPQVQQIDATFLRVP